MVALVLAVGLGGSAVLARVVSLRSFFVHDDYASFLLFLGADDLLRYALTPIDVHVVPLQRAITAAAFAAWGLDYAPSVFLLWGLHALGLAYAFSALSMLLPRTVAACLVTVQAVSPLIVAPLGYFSAGAHRFPAALAVYAAAFHYLAFVRGRCGLHALACILGLVIGLGCFVKAALIPLTLLGVTIALGARACPLRRAAPLLASMLLVAAAHLLALRTVWPKGTVDWSVGLALTREVLPTAAEILVRALALDTEAVLPRPSLGMLGPVAVVALGLVALSLRNALTLAVFGALWLAHWVVIAVSPRGQWFGEFALSALRYQFELLPLVTLLAGVAIANSTARRPVLGAALRGPVIAGALAMATGAYGVAAVRHGTELCDSARYDEFRRTRDYVTRLRASVLRIPRRQRASLRIAPGVLPSWLLGLHTPRYGDLRKFLRLFGVRAAYRAPHRYVLTASGEVVPRRRAGRRVVSARGTAR